jgi:hypothetical protein
MVAMRRKQFISLLLILTLIPGTLAFFSSASAGRSLFSAYFQQPGNEICVAAADEGGSPGDDLLTLVSLASGVQRVIGSPGTTRMEAIAFQPGTGVLFGTSGDGLGRIDLITGAYTALPSLFGTANGSEGLVALTDIDGLSFDPNTGILYASHRRETRPNRTDLLFQVDLQTGTFVNDAFGVDRDYVEIGEVAGLVDIDDIAVDPVDSTLYAIANTGGRQDRLVTINKQTGASQDKGIVNVFDMEGLGFDTTGQLVGTTGKDGGARSNFIWRIDKTNGMAELSTAQPLLEGNDYEAVDCLITEDQIPTPLPSVTPEITPTEPTAIELVSFDAQLVAGNSVRLQWVTAAEIDNLGFNIYRSFDGSLATAEKIHFEPVQSGPGGHVYEFTDTQAGAVQWYWLADVSSSNEESFHGPVMIALSQGSNRLFVPIVVSR